MGGTHANHEPDTPTSSRVTTDTETVSPGAGLMVGSLTPVSGLVYRPDAQPLPDQADPLGGTAIPKNALAALRRNQGTGQPLPNQADPLGGTAIPQNALAALRRNQGTGQPLPDDLSVTAGRALGQDLSPVRIHTDTAAAALASSVEAVAFTHGHDIYFSANSYRPTEPQGQRLIAHELGHIGQPDSGAGGTIGHADDPAEAAADRAAIGVIAALRRRAALGRVAAYEDHQVHDHSIDRLRRMTVAKAGQPTIRRIARDALVEGRSYHLLVDDAHRVATFLGTEARGTLTEYWFSENDHRFYLKSTDTYPVMTDAEWQDNRATLAGLRAGTVAWEEYRAQVAGVTQDEKAWADGVAPGGSNRYFLMAALAKWRPLGHDIVLPQKIIATGVVGRPVYDIVTAAAGLVTGGKASAGNVLGIVTSYLTGPLRQALLVQFFGNLNRLSVSDAATFIGDGGRWMPNLMQLDNLLQLVLAVPGPRGLAALRHAQYVFASSQTLLEMVQHAPTADFAVLQWVANAGRPSGDTARARADSGEFIHSYHAVPAWQQAAQWIVRDMAQHDAARVAVHDYVTNNGAVTDPSVLHERFIAVRRSNGNPTIANNGLGANYTLGDAHAILVASQVPRKHTASNAREAEAKTVSRDEGTTANSSTMTGIATLQHELHRVMVHYRAEIANLPNNAMTPLLELGVATPEDILFRDGPVGVRAQRVPWSSLEVVFAKNGAGGLVLVHAQPNSRPARL